MERQDFIDGLRQLADIYARNPQLEVPSYLPTWWIFTYNAEDFIRQIAAFGSGAKKYQGEDIEFTPNVLLDLKINCKRETICTRKVVGKKVIPAKVIPATAEQVIPAHEEDVVEWECRPILASKSATATSAPIIEARDEVGLIAEAQDIPFSTT